jgi:putative FmdB family regulatory protein
VPVREVGVPLFEYECRKCGNHFEALVVGSRKPTCPKCKSEDLEKKVSAFGLAGVGSGGWSGRASGCGPTGGG